MAGETTEREKATCRGCGRALKGDAYCYGGRAYHPTGGHECPANYYGGFVCSRECDVRASLQLERSMPGHGIRQTELSREASEHIARNWRQYGR